MSRVKIAPSILSADFTRLGEHIREAEAGGADWIHVDVMDGHFVPNITIGPLIAAAARRSTRLPIDVHLMIEAPERYLAAFAEAGADYLTVHVETSPHLHRTVQQIQVFGKKAGVSLNPSTHESALEYVIKDVDLVLVMSVNPGFGGQAFIESAVPKVRAVMEMAKRSGRDRPLEIQVDGGINGETARAVEKAGATVAVAGSFVFGSKDYAKAIAAVRGTQKRLG